MDRAHILQFIQRFPFGSLFLCARDGSHQVAHLPFHLEDEVLIGHLARANPVHRHFDGATLATVVFMGPHGYISPKAYGSLDNVPTWNYATAQVTGKPQLTDPQDLEVQLQKQVTPYESDGPYRVENLPKDYLDRLKKALVGFRIPINTITGKLKMSQNRTPAEQSGVLDYLSQGTNGERELHQFMTELLDQET